MPGRRDPKYVVSEPARGFSLTQFMPLRVIICKGCGFVESYYAE
jgi:hypothetical protein